MPKTVAVDFDNTIHPYTRGWIGAVPDDEPPIDGAEKFLTTLLDRGYYVTIHSTRAETQDGKNAMLRWLRKHLPTVFYAIRDTERVSISAGKPKAIAYVDDRAVPFRGDFNECLEQIEMLDIHGPFGGHRLNK